MTKDSADHLRHLAGMEKMRTELEKMEANISHLEQLKMDCPATGQSGDGGQGQVVP